MTSSISDADSSSGESSAEVDTGNDGKRNDDGGGGGMMIDNFLNAWFREGGGLDIQTGSWTKMASGRLFKAISIVMKF